MPNLLIPTKIVNLIRLSNSNAKCAVRVQGKLSNSFETDIGLSTGDALLLPVRDNADEIDLKVDEISFQQVQDLDTSGSI